MSRVQILQQVCSRVVLSSVGVPDTYPLTASVAVRVRRHPGAEDPGQLELLNVRYSMCSPPLFDDEVEQLFISKAVFIDTPRMVVVE